MTLRTKTSLLLAAITFLALGVTSLFYLQFLQQSLKDSILSGVEAVAKSNADAIALFLRDSLNDTQVAAMALPTAALEKNDGPALERRLQQLVETYPKFENGMFILDKNGHVWVDYPPAPKVRGMDVSYREYFKRTMAEQRGVVGLPYISTRTGQPVLTFTALLRGSDNRVLGVLGCSVQILSPNALGGISDTRIGKSGYIYVYDKSRLMILHPEADRVLKRDVPAGVNWLFDAAMHGFEGIGETVNSRGVPMLLAVKGIPGTDWIVGAQQLQSEAYAPITKAWHTLWAGLLLTVAASLAVGTFAVRRITRPLTRLRQGVMLLEAAEVEGSRQIELELADIRSSDEIGELAGAFNQMMHELSEQRDRLVQAERVAAWRELARRLAHELKNPLFPLQITVENLDRAKREHPDQFEEVFRESTTTLLAELANLKTIIGRFSDFAKMPTPQFETVDLNELVRAVLRLLDAQVTASGAIQTETDLDPHLPSIQADPEQIKRALQNLALNAMDAMPGGGTLRIQTRQYNSTVILEVSDSGQGLTKEECDRLFTPYYTTKQYGTGLGLAIVQSVISDHHGSISVESQPGKGATFRIELNAP